MSRQFSDTLSEGPAGTERTGIDRGDFTLQHDLGEGRRLCARVKGNVRFDERDGSIREMPPGSSVSVETRGRTGSQRMVVTAAEGGPRHEWWLNGASHPPDDAARAWLKDALEVVAGYRAIGSIQGQVGGLQGEIGGHHGAIGGLEAQRWQASAAEKARIDDEIAGHRAEIKKLEAEMERRQFDRRLTDAEAEVRRAEENGRSEIAELQRKIKDAHAEERIDRLQRQIADLHAEDRIERFGS